MSKDVQKEDTNSYQTKRLFVIFRLPQSKSRAQRRLVDFNMQVTCSRGVFDAAIVNVSKTGLLIKTTAMLKVGEPVVLARRGINFPGKVVWVRGRRAGIRANDLIDLEALTAKSGLGAMKSDSGYVSRSRYVWHWRRSN